ncbi:MAG: Crp/Fnr family transcriptional regulator [Acidimicrobiia bacterium]|nr:Crp/Fnr family transcriptional regulator [Acidimicrobiia bacterium]MBV8560008.1 Crp/Fnr family transcriptional regulator [Acidimicrobiia bacterium]
MRQRGDNFQSARKRLLGQLGSGDPPAIVGRVVDATLLSSTPFFAGLDAAAVDAVAALCARRALKRNDILFREGEEATELFVVERGRVAIANRSEDGRESLVALMEAGDLFGEMGLFDGVRSADARALETSTVVVVPYAPLREALDRQPTALWAVVELLARRIRAVDEALADTVFLDVPGRTAKRLLELAGDGDQFQLPVTQEELASMVGASRERVNKAISQFVRLGWLEQQDRIYRIRNRDQLTLRAR